VDPVGIDRGVGGEHVGTHAVAHGDDAGRSLVGGALDPRRHAVAAAELLLLPGAQGLERVGGEDVRDPVQEPADVAREVGVPGVGVDDVDPGRGVHHLEIDAERLDGGVGAQQGARDGMGDGVGSRLPEAVDVDLDLAPQLGDEVLDVHSCSAVDVRWPLAGQHSDAHGPSLEVKAASILTAVPMPLG